MRNLRLHLFFNFFLILIKFLTTINTKIILLMAEHYEDCTKNGPAKYVDLSGLEFEYVNDTTFYLNGETRT